MTKLQILSLVFPTLIALNTNPVYAEEVFLNIRQEIPEEISEYFVEEEKEEVVEEEEIVVENYEYAKPESVIIPEQSVGNNSVTFEIPDYPGMKKWMSYKAFSGSSKQALLQQLAYTDVSGCRIIDQRYCVAIGTHYGAEIGQFVDLVLENGVVIPCVMGDAKSPQHTDVQNIFSNTTKNLCASEFIVDTDCLEATCKQRGDMSYLYDCWNSPVDQVIVYDINAFDEVQQ